MVGIKYCSSISICRDVAANAPSSKSKMPRNRIGKKQINKANKTMFLNNPVI